MFLDKISIFSFTIISFILILAAFHQNYLDCYYMIINKEFFFHHWKGCQQ